MSQPKSNEEIVEEFRAMRPIICSVSAVSDDACDWLRSILAQKDAEVAEAYKQGYKDGVGQPSPTTMGALTSDVGITSEENLPEIETDYTQVKVITNGDKQ